MVVTRIEKLSCSRFYYKHTTNTTISYGWLIITRLLQLNITVRNSQLPLNMAAPKDQAWRRQCNAQHHKANIDNLFSHNKIIPWLPKSTNLFNSGDSLLPEQLLIMVYGVIDLGPILRVLPIGHNQNRISVSLCVRQHPAAWFKYHVIMWLLITLRQHF